MNNPSDEERRDAERTGAVLRKRLLEIMDLQADIDALLRDEHPTPFGSQKWQYASTEALMRLVAMTAVQFLLFEPVDLVKGNEKVKRAAGRLLDELGDQLKTLSSNPNGDCRTEGTPHIPQPPAVLPRRAG